MKKQLCKLANLDHKLPMPDRGGRIFRKEGETVDISFPFWKRCLADGSIVEVEEKKKSETSKS